MPYKNIDELPDSIQQALPKHAREIFLAAFNNAWDQYKDKKDRRGDASRQETAAKVAWAAVKQKYKKQDGHWQEKKK